MHVFVAAAEVDTVRRDLDAGLPERFRGWPVRFDLDGVPDQHHVRVSTLADWLHDHLGLDPRTGITLLDWQLAPQQTLLEATRGQVHADPDGELDGRQACGGSRHRLPNRLCGSDVRHGSRSRSRLSHSQPEVSQRGSGSGRL